MWELNWNIFFITFNPERVTGTGENGGWYLLKKLLSSDDGYDSTTGLNNFSGNFIASLETIPGQTVKPGTVEAQLQIIMELQ